MVSLLAKVYIVSQHSSRTLSFREKYNLADRTLTLFDMGFFNRQLWGGGGGYHNFVVIAPMIMKSGTGIKLDVFYTMVTKNCDVTTIM